MRLTFAAMTIAIAAKAAPGLAASFETLDLPPSFSPQTVPYEANMSRDGRFVVGSYYDPDPSLPFPAYPFSFLWSADAGNRLLGPVPDGFSAARPQAVSTDGTVVVGILDGQEERGFRWTESAGFEVLSAENPSRAWAITPGGDTIVGAGLAPGPGIFRPEDVDVPAPGPITFSDINSHAITSDASFVAGFGMEEGRVQAIRWDRVAGWQTLGVLPGQEHWTTSATALSDDGQRVVGGSYFIGPDVQSGTSEPFVWDAAGGMRPLGHLGIPSTLPPEGFALGVSADGFRVVGWTSTDGEYGTGAFVWSDERGLESLAILLETAGVDLDGWILSAASSISGDGQVVAGFAERDGLQRIFVASIPEPTPALQLAIGLACLSRSSRKPSQRRTTGTTRSAQPRN